MKKNPFYYKVKSPFVMLEHNTKGQLISKGLFDSHRFDQKPKEIFLRISALASNKRSDQKK